MATSNAENKADLWLDNLSDKAHSFLSKYKDYAFEDRSGGDANKKKPYNRVKIAVFDTGAAHSAKSGTPETIKISKSRISWRKFEGSAFPPQEDEDGHGTQVVSILLKVTPYAKLYIYRILVNAADPIQPKIVAAALENAVKQGVDIVNMSFGWDHELGDGHNELRVALHRCIEKSILIFAATSNDDLESSTGMAYPARADGVIAVDAGTSQGEWLGFNPTRDNQFKTHRFTALGEGIKTDFPPQHQNKEILERMSGTSAATPIASGIAALVLEFARQPPLGYAPDIAEVLKRPEVMREVLAGAVAAKYTKNGEYYHLVPSKLFKVDGASNCAGNWYELNTCRYETAQSIIAVLKNKYGSEIAHPMNERIELWWTQRALRG